MSIKTPTGKDSVPIDALGISLDRGTAGMLSTGGHLVANFIPFGPGAALNLAADAIDKSTIQENIVETWKDGIAQRITLARGKAVDSKELEGENGIALVEQYIGSMPKEVQDEWNRAGDLGTKFLDFGIGTGAGVLPMMVIGGWTGAGLGLVSGFAAGSVSKAMLGNYDKPSAGMVVSAIHTLAHEQQQRSKSGRVGADRTLVGLYLVLSNDKLMKEYDRDDLIDMFQAHIQAKQENPRTVTDLEMYIDEANEEHAFIDYIPKDTNYGAFHTNSALDIVTNRIGSQKDFTDILFETGKFQKKIVLDSYQTTEIADASKALYQSIQQPTGNDGARVAINPELARKTPPSRN